MNKLFLWHLFVRMYVYDSMSLIYFLNWMIASGLTYDVQYVKDCFNEYEAQVDIFWCVQTRHYESMWLECEFPDQ